MLRCSIHHLFSSCSPRAARCTSGCRRRELPVPCTVTACCRVDITAVPSTLTAYQLRLWLHHLSPVDDRPSQSSLACFGVGVVVVSFRLFIVCVDDGNSVYLLRWNSIRPPLCSSYNEQWHEVSDSLWSIVGMTWSIQQPATDVLI